MQCSQCKLNFCLRHRHSSDHDCKPTASIQPAPSAAAAAGSSQGIFRIFSDTRAKAAQAAENRRQRTQEIPKARQVQAPPVAVAQRTSATQVQNIQGNMVRLLTIHYSS